MAESYCLVLRSMLPPLGAEGAVGAVALGAGRAVALGAGPSRRVSSIMV